MSRSSAGLGGPRGGAGKRGLDGGRMIQFFFVFSFFFLSFALEEEVRLFQFGAFWASARDDGVGGGGGRGPGAEGGGNAIHGDYN